MTISIVTELPEDLFNQLKAVVEKGPQSIDEVVVEAVAQLVGGEDV
ncbi:MAG: hypothetical protein F6K65_22290 [Moorea sp. SIO3C2]|nr:hypothetical protein [Moorena sp. SIO3C2]